MDNEARLPISTVDFPSPESLRKAATRVQNEIIRRLPISPIITGKRKFELVQARIIPSKREIESGLLMGRYQEYLR